MIKENFPPYRIFSVSTVSFLLGVGVGSFYLIKLDVFSLIFLFVLFIFGLLCLLFRVKAPFIVLTVFFWLLLGVLYTGRAVDQFKRLEEEKENFQGIIVSKIERSYKDQKLIVEVEPEGVYSYVSLPSFPACDFGDSLKLTGKLISTENSPLENSLKSKKVNTIISQPKDIICEKSDLPIWFKLKGMLYGISSSFEESLNKALSEPSASLAAGLILGVKKNLSEDFREALNSTGLTHIVALSGYNVTIIISVLTSLLAGYLSRRWVFGLGFFFILLFIIMTGASSSVVRAGIFSFTLLYGKLIGRKGYMLNLLLLAALVMVLVNPFLIVFDIGFQLSFLAFSGLIFVAEPLKNHFGKYKVPDFINLTLSETLGAQLLVFPLILYYFGRFSIIAPISNLMVLWLVPWAMLFSFIVGFFGLFFIPLAKLMAVFAWGLLSMIIFIINITAKIPFSSFEVGINNVWFLCIYGIIPIIIIWRGVKKQI